MYTDIFINIDVLTFVANVNASPLCHFLIAPEFRPGTYEVKPMEKPKHVEWQGSFGGAPTNVPGAEESKQNFSTKSSIPCNTDKLPSTSKDKLYYRRLAYLKLHYK